MRDPAHLGGVAAVGEHRGAVGGGQRRRGAAVGQLAVVLVVFRIIIAPRLLVKQRQRADGVLDGLQDQGTSSRGDVRAMSDGLPVVCLPAGRLFAREGSIWTLRLTVDPARRLCCYPASCQPLHTAP